MQQQSTKILIILGLLLVFVSAGTIGYLILDRVLPKPAYKVLAVPLISQPQQFACNITATAMVLQYRGIDKEPGDVYAALPKQEQKRTESRWGNPNIGFVGNLYGVAGGDGTEGYGVHWDPIAEYLHSYVKAEVKRNWNIKEMLLEVDKGNPSIVWFQNNYDTPRLMRWKTEDSQGKEVEINAVYGMHSEVVIGYIGTPDEPSALILNDPWKERWDNKSHSYITSDFERLWAFYDQTAIVVGEKI